MGVEKNRELEKKDSTEAGASEDGGSPKVAAGEKAGETIGSTASLTHPPTPCRVVWLSECVTGPQNGGRNDPGSKSQFFRRRSHSLRILRGKAKRAEELLGRTVILIGENGGNLL